MFRSGYIGTLIVAGAAFAVPHVGLAQAPPCPPPTYDLEELKIRLLEYSEDPNPHGAIRSTLSNGVFATPCPIIETELGRDALAEDLVRWVSQQDNLDLNNAVHGGVRSAVRLGYYDPAFEGPALPFEALVYAVEEGATRVNREIALSSMIRMAGDPQVRTRLLEWTRAERGPAGLEDRPEQIGWSIYFIQYMEEADLFRAALESDPSSIRNASVRCWAEGRARPGGHGPPRRPDAGSPC